MKMNIKIQMKHLTDLKVAELHANKLLQEINILRAEQRNADMDDMLMDGGEDVSLDPFEMIKELFMSMDKNNNAFINRIF